MSGGACANSMNILLGFSAYKTFGDLSASSILVLLSVADAQNLSHQCVDAYILGCRHVGLLPYSLTYTCTYNALTFLLTHLGL